MNNIIHTIRHAARAATVLLLALLAAQTAGAQTNVSTVSGFAEAFNDPTVSVINVTDNITGVGNLSSLDRDLTINLNGHTISSDELHFNVGHDVSLTINVGGNVGNIISGDADEPAIINSGTVTLRNVNITTNSDCAIWGPGMLYIGNSVSFNGWTGIPFDTEDVNIIEGGNYNYDPGNPFANVVATVTVGGVTHYFENSDIADDYAQKTGGVVDFSLSGDTYTIKSSAGWNLFCDLLADNTKGFFDGKTVRLGADIGTADDPVTSMAGASGKDFTGTFDGQGHTLTVGYGTADAPFGEQYAAPFRYIEDGCTIKNLHVAGHIYTADMFAGGLAGSQYGTVSIENCRVSTVIHSSVSGDGTHGGFVAVNNSNSTLTIEGCLFDGRLLGSSTIKCGGFVGWRNGGCEIRNSLFAPTEVTVGTDRSATFARNTVDTYNSYYTYLLNDGTNYAPALADGTVRPAKWHNGKACHSVTAGENVTIDAIALNGDATEYTVSGITAYSGGGLQRDENLYYGSDDQLRLTLSNSLPATPEGYQYDGFTASAGTLDGSTLTMPDQDVTVSLALTVLPWSGDGSEGNPYIIYNKDQLDLLAHRVNGTHGETRQTDGYEDTFFQLANDISYTHTSDWNAFTNDESNFEAIGGYHKGGSHRSFCGHFDGNNKTISGIRIYKDGTANTDKYQGIFGRTSSSADIHDLTLADARITGKDYTGGIVGYNNGTVSRCHVANDVALCAVQSDAGNHGGIAGNNWGTIEQCTSAATLTTADANSAKFYGGIAGRNIDGTLRDNLAIGATVPAAKDNTYGAITGYNDGEVTLQRNYYAACTVADEENATGVGCGYIDDGNTTADITTDDGAVPGYFLTLGEGVTSSALSITIPKHKELNSSGQLVTVAARTYNVAAEGTTVWFKSDKADGYSASYSVNGSPVSGNSITMPAAPVTVTSNGGESIDLWGIADGANGSSGHPYTITTTEGWNLLAGNVAAGESYSGKHFQLGADNISISTMVGTNACHFSGHFNGNGNTLAIDITSVGEYTAPFRYVGGATITGVHTTGTVTTAHKFATGLVGRHDGNLTISNCRSSVAIVSSVSGDGIHGGFVATGSGTATIEGCLFDGVICTTASDPTNSCGGFVGWNSGTVNISNSLYAPASVPEDKHAIGTDGCATFARNGVNSIANSYYTESLGDAQGKQARSITAGDGVTLAHAGVATHYATSGITAYKATGASADSDPFIAGLLYNNNVVDVLYAGSGDVVSLTLSNTGAPEGYQYDGYTTNAGTLNGSTLTMPDEDVTVSAALRSTGEHVEVSYVDAYGTTQPAWAIALDGTETSLTAGWYFVGLPTVAFDHMLNLNGIVHLILADGCTMNVTSSNDIGIYVNGSLTIYGQTGGTGTLNATGLSEGITTNSGNLTISGGRVTATGDNGYGIYTDGGNITISGGMVTATGGAGIFIYGGTITLGCTTASDFIYVSSYFVGPGGSLNIADGQTLFDEDGNYYSGTIFVYADPHGKTLRPGLTARQAPDGNFWTTYYNGTRGFTIDDDENACAYTATYGAGKLTLHKLGKQIPAETAVIIVAENNVVSMTATTLPPYNDPNDLHGVDVDTDLADITSDLGDGTIYVLGMTTVKNEQHFGFHRYTGSTMAAHKAFVLVSGGQALARSLTMVFDEATGIGDATRLNNKEEIKNNNWFTLDGRRLQAKPTDPGIYINNGRKVVIK